MSMADVHRKLIVSQQNKEAVRLESWNIFVPLFVTTASIQLKFMKYKRHAFIFFIYTCVFNK